MSATPAAMMREHPVRWPWSFLVGFILTAIAASVLVTANDESLVDQIPFIVAFSVFGAVGALIVSRARGNRVGFLLLWGSALPAVSFLASEIVTYAVRHGTTEGPSVGIAGIVSNIGWAIGILPVFVLLPQIFPDGHVLSRRWGWFAWATMAVLGLLTVGIVFGEPTLTGSVDSVTIDNPLFIPALGEVGISDAVVNWLLFAALIGAVTSLILRFRRSERVERQQIKWVAASIVFLIASFVLSLVLANVAPLFDTIVTATAILSIPVSIGISVLQYRLFELDVVVTKALIAGALVLIVIGAYAGLVWVFGAVASGRESSTSLFVLALLLGLAFRPVARFARKVADRVVYGRRATPYEVLTEFSERVGDAYATQDVLGRMATILGEGVGARVARVWLRVGDELRPSSTWPPSAPPAEILRVAGDTLPEIAGETAVEVRDGGELLGVLSVRMPTSDPITPAKERLVRDLASQAGLVLRNVRLVEELRASQRRIVAAQDQERRRIERNIHDGAQQQLVALTVKMRLAQSLASRDAAKTAAMLAQMQEETQTALEDLRDLARGIYPPLLADQGLPAALEAQARKSVVPVTVETDGIGRYPQEVEAAVYFSVLEALQNVAKYAEAEHATVALAHEDGHLTFSVRDDGKGFVTDETGHGSGLQGISDRLGALGGGMAVTSAPGAGTVVAGRVPGERT